MRKLDFDIADSSVYTMTEVAATKLPQPAKQHSDSVAKPASSASGKQFDQSLLQMSNFATHVSPVEFRNKTS